MRAASRAAITYRVGGEASLLHSSASAEGPLPGRGAFLVSLRVFLNAIPVAGTYTLTARAFSEDAVVAVAPASAPFEVTREALTDLGTITLSPCGAACPPLE